MRNTTVLKLKSDSDNSYPGDLNIEYDNDNSVELNISERTIEVSASELIKAVKLIEYQMRQNDK